MRHTTQTESEGGCVLSAILYRVRGRVRMWQGQEEGSGTPPAESRWKGSRGEKADFGSRRVVYSVERTTPTLAGRRRRSLIMSARMKRVV